MVWILSLKIYYSNFSFFRMKLFNYLLQQTKVNGWVWLLQAKKIGEFVSYELQQNRWVSILQAKNNMRLISDKAHFKDYWAKWIVNQKALLSIRLKQSCSPWISFAVIFTNKCLKPYSIKGLEYIIYDNKRYAKEYLSPRTYYSSYIIEYSQTTKHLPSR